MGRFIAAILVAIQGLRVRFAPAWALTILRIASTYPVLVLCVAACTSGDVEPAHARFPPRVTLPPVDFTTEVLPILEARCFECHDEGTASLGGGLRLDTRLEASRRRAGGLRAIEPGSPDDSTLVARIESDESALRMPPDRPLARAEIATLRRWIAEGAPYDEHWAYDAPSRPAVPSGATNPIDAFLDESLARVGLEPSPRADPAVQLRRASLALTGLPPTPEEIDAFLADPSDAAYEATIDRLLEDERHAEHLARDWLDHVGYSDSNGMYMDVERDSWPYREWVIWALRERMPFDEFLSRQLAGDLRPGATDDDVLATGFLRLHRTTEEGGIHGDEFRALYASERAVMTANAMLGVTMQCARCHAHRYDPLTQRDYYRLTACFHRVDDTGGSAPLVPPRLGEIRPTIHALGPLQREALAAARIELAAARSALAAHAEAASFTAAQRAWEAALRREPARWTPALIVSAAASEGSSLSLAGGRVTASGATPHVEQWTLVLAPSAPIRAIRLRDLVPSGTLPVAISEVRLRARSGTTRRTLALEAPGADALTDGATSTDLEVPAEVLLVLPRPITVAPGESLELTLDMRRGNGRTASAITFEVSSDPAASLDADLAAIVATPLERRSTVQSEALRRHFARFGSDDSGLYAAAARLRLAERREAELALVPATRIMRDDAPANVTHVLSRGDFYRPLEEVRCGVPEALTDGPPEVADRAALAAWIVGSENPLTARVIANRLFQLVFGRGIVATPQDLGARGALPSHPELLDWLAVELLESGWDARHVLRLLATSNAFRRASEARAEVSAIDPMNELLARGPRRRLDAEVLRDIALFASGLLVEERGGPSVRPYHPPGLYEQLVDDENPMRTYRPDRAPRRIHRRAIYTFWRRGTLLPSLALLDAADRMTPVARREVTITPTQSLALMNEPLFVEAARALAERERRLHPGDVRAQIVDTFRRVLGRPPTTEEMEPLRTLYDEELAAAAADPSALGALHIGEADLDTLGDPAAHAALTALARVVLTLSEALYLE